MAKYATSPWKLESNGVQIIDVNQLRVCLLAPGVYQEANEHLIVTSPQLLEALTGIIKIGKRDTSNPKYDPYFEFAKQVIDEATGKRKSTY